jgi:uncharacterized SAM-binding protein YcdF (DUF218 family)
VIVLDVERSVSSAWCTARRTVVVGTAVVTVLAVLNGAAGCLIFSNATDSVVSRVDAVVVLGGEHDGRENYGLALAPQVHASSVVLSDPYPTTDPLMKRLCLPRNEAVEVICSRPDPSTTHGEALMTRRLAGERQWKNILVISWRYHLPRARLIFNQCLSATGVSVTAKAIPRQYVLPVWYWQYVYLYQFAGIAKAVASDCG